MEVLHTVQMSIVPGKLVFTNCLMLMPTILHNYQHPSSSTEGNLAVVTDPHPIPSGLPAVSVTEPSLDSVPSEIDFIGVWHTPVISMSPTYASIVAHGTPPPKQLAVERETFADSAVTPS
jgi:hypothetical protein